MKQISANEISIVVQGTIHEKYTKKCLNSLRRAFPGAEIILSTWKGMKVAGLSFDKLLLNDDPGAICMDRDNRIPYNINRMLLSSQMGISQATRPYILKCRSDLYFSNANIINYWNRFPNRDSEYQITAHRIIVGSLFTLKFELGDQGKKHYTPFHISDFYCLGRAEDIRLLYDIPLVDLQQFARYFEYNCKPREYPIDAYQSRLWKFPPEQYLGVELMRKKICDLDFPNCLTYDTVSHEMNERMIVNNFIILDRRQSGIIGQKFPFNLWSRLEFCPERIWCGLYRNYIYMQDYKKYCDSKYKLPEVDIELKYRRYAKWYHILKKWGKPVLKPIYYLLCK